MPEPSRARRNQRPDAIDTASLRAELPHLDVIVAGDLGQKDFDDGMSIPSCCIARA